MEITKGDFSVIGNRRMDAVSIPHSIIITASHTVGNNGVAVGQTGASIDIPQLRYLLADCLGFLLSDELGGLDTVYHQAQFVWLKDGLGDIVAPFAGVILNGNVKVLMESKNVIVDGFGGCLNVLCH